MSTGHGAKRNTTFVPSARGGPSAENRKAKKRKERSEEHYVNDPRFALTYTMKADRTYYHDQDGHQFPGDGLVFRASRTDGTPIMIESYLPGSPWQALGRRSPWHLTEKMLRWGETQTGHILKGELWLECGKEAGVVSYLPIYLPHPDDASYLIKVLDVVRSEVNPRSKARPRGLSLPAVCLTGAVLSAS